MYIAIFLVVALALAAAIGFVFYKVEVLKSQIDLLKLRTAQTQVTPRSSSAREGKKADDDSKAEQRVIRPQIPAKGISWGTVSFTAKKKAKTILKPRVEQRRSTSIVRTT